MTVYPERTLKALQRARTQLAAGKAQDAIRELQKVVAKVPKGEEAWMLLAQAYGQRSAHGEALDCYQRVTRISPKNAVAWFNLGMAHTTLRRYAEAIKAYAEAIRHTGGDYPAAVMNMGRCFIQLDQYDMALQVFEAYLEDFSPNADVYSLTGIARQGQQDSAAAAEAYRKALEFGPGGYTLHLNLGSCLHVLHDYRGAADHAARALDFQRDDPVARFNLGTALFALGEIDKARETWKGVPRPEATLSRLAALSYLEPFDGEGLLAEHRTWGEALVAACAAEAALAPPIPRPGPRAKLRLGFVSPDFREHPVAFFLEGLLRHLDRERFELFLYFDAPNRDEVTARFQRLADRWVELYPTRDPRAAAERIRADQVDVLFDLAGMTSPRVEVFGRRIAPVQVSYLGYASTTGLPTIDYVLSDALLDPPGLTEAHYSEKLVRLGNCFATYTPPAGAPLPAERPMKRKGYPVLASVARLNKISDGALDLWCSALRSVPDARLLILAQGLHHAGIQAALLERLTQRGVAPERVELRGSLPMRAYLELHSDIDLMLDTTPWSGHTTTLHGLWMGVPTVTFEQAHHAGRFTTMVMENAGLPEFVARDAAGFSEQVRRLLADDALMDRVRAEGRERMRSSALMEHAALARAFQDACHTMWAAYAGESTDDHLRAG
ncbi:MAG TPA: tetratricopeptide repeat protein [Aromatoleum sp.]|uniref:O-linked N-acetylglucosamine transferase, SPINDLY family protein n=1 Tax=Aromatoleum sp. TaxID=2307007 RepID=UPI002B483175|nr:tetratricopeptide repeat protein [Aromatoleum sp.]HJV25594.1 tetratricopeptide repeat protein [Aromatoleum sp.]